MSFLPIMSRSLLSRPLSGKPGAIAFLARFGTPLVSFVYIGQRDPAGAQQRRSSHFVAQSGRSIPRRSSPMIKHIAGIVFVFVVTAFAWVVLGTTVAVRTGTQDDALRGEVGQLWGTPQKQTAPVISYEVQKSPPKPPVVTATPAAGGPKTVPGNAIPPAPNGVGTGPGTASGERVVT